MFRFRVYAPLIHLILVAGLSLFLARDFFRPGLPVSHDGVSHVARLASFNQSFREGNLIPRWGANLNAGYGHPVLMFLYPLTNYLGAVFHLSGFSLVNSVKLVFLAGFVLAGLGMYWWLRELLPGESAGPAFFGACLYQLTPYRGVDLLVRGALGENTAFAMVPFVGVGLAELIKTRQRHWFLFTALSYAFLVLAHNALALVLSGVLAGLIMIQIGYAPVNKRLSLALIGSALVFGLGLSTFFWFPAFFEGKYTLRDVVTSTELLSKRFPSLGQLIALPWEGTQDPDFTPTLGPVNLVLVGAGWVALLIRRQFKQSWWHLLWLNLVTILSLVLMQSISLPLWRQATILPKFQFPWRLLALPAVSVPILAALISERVRSQWFDRGLILLVLASVGLAVPLYRAPGFKAFSDQYFLTEYLGTTDTGESSPRWSVRGMEARAKVPAEVISGQAQIAVEELRTTRHRFSVKAQNQARIKDNTLYFPGWQVLVDGRPVVIEFQDQNHRGLMTFDVPGGDHLVTVKFGETKLRLTADLVSLVSGLGFIVIALGPRLSSYTQLTEGLHPKR